MIHLMRRGIRGFVSSWQSTQPWLRVEHNADGEDIFFCDYCIKAEVPSEKQHSLKDVKACD